jgi:hypothetical protein
VSERDIVERLRDAHQTVPIPAIASLYSNAADEIERLGAEMERLRAALRYISSPTMSLPGGADAAQHALVADERAVRLALETCIRTAREALTNGSASAAHVGDPS